MRRARLAEASVCRGRGVAAAAQGARQGRERRVEKAHASCAVAALRIGQQPATARLLPVSSLSLSLYSLSISLSFLYPVYRITAVSQCSSRVTTAQCLPRVVVRSTALSLRLVSTEKFVARPKLHRPPNRIDCFFFLYTYIIKATASRNVSSRYVRPVR